MKERRELLRSKALPLLSTLILYSLTPDGKLRDLVASVREQKFEGLTANPTDSAYESGARSGVRLEMKARTL